MTATPDTNLVQGDDVTVNGTGATPNSFVGFAQCLTGATGLDDCAQLQSFASVSSGGNFATITTPRRILSIAGVTHDCADPATCELAAISAESETASILATAPIQFDPSIPPPPPPSLTVTPSTGLVQGDVVEVVGTDFAPNQGVGVVQCLPDAGGSSGPGCDLSTLLFVPSDSSGGFTTTFTPLRIITTANGTHDCALEACIIGAGVPPGNEGDRVTIAFDPNVPPPPPPTVAITPSEGLRDGQVVTVTGKDFRPGQSIGVVQCGNPATNGGTNCDLGRIDNAQVASDGTFSHQFTVLRSMTTPDGAIDCGAAPATCVIGAGTGSGFGNESPISFATTAAGGGTAGGGTTARAVSGTPTYAG
jgi:hypothetical protein